MRSLTVVLFYWFYWSEYEHFEMITCTLAVLQFFPAPLQMLHELQLCPVEDMIGLVTLTVKQVAEQAA